MRVMRIAAALVVAAAGMGVGAEYAAGQTATSVVIREFRVRGPNGAADEFVEIYNASPTAVDVSGWKLRRSNTSGTINDNATIPSSTVLSPGKSFLFANSSTSGGPYSGSVSPDLTYGTGIVDAGGIAITLSDNTVVDQVGMGSGSAFKEGTPLSSLSGDLDRGYARVATGTSGAIQDSGNNSADFAIVRPSAPRNMTSTPVPDTPTANVVGSTTRTIDEDDPAIAFDINLDDGDASLTQTVECQIISRTIVGDPAAITDVNGTDLTSVSLPYALPNASASLTTITVTPLANQFGSIVFEVRPIDDGPINDAGDTVTLTVTIRSVNDPPDFTLGSNVTHLTPTSGAQVLSGFVTLAAQPTGETGESITYSWIVSDPSGIFTGTPLTITTATGDVSYDLSGTSGMATVTVTAQDDGTPPEQSAAKSFKITVSDFANTAPSFTSGGDDTVLEDSGPKTVTSWATSISPGSQASESTQAVTFTVQVENGSLFTGAVVVSLTSATTADLVYTPASNAFGSSRVTITAVDDGGTANGGSNSSAPVTILITITGVNDPPAFTLALAATTVAEDSGAHTVTGVATITSTGAANEAQAVTFSATTDKPSFFSVQPAVSTATGSLTFTLAANAFGTALVTVTAVDDGDTSNGGQNTSAPETFTITVTAVNDRPTFTPGPDFALLEDAPQVVTLWASAISSGGDPFPDEGQTVTFSATPDLPALFTGPVVVSPNGELFFTPASNAFGVAKVTVVARDDGGTASGGVATSTAHVLTVTLTAVNDPPTFTTAFAATTSAEDAGPLNLAGYAGAISAGPGETQSLAFVVTNDNNALFTTQPAVSTAGALTYQTAADANGAATITVRLVDDGGTANGGVPTSTAATLTLTVSPVNDPPSFTIPQTLATVLEDAGARTVPGFATSISAGPPDEAGQSVTFAVTSNNTALFFSQPAIAPDGTLSFTPFPNANGSATLTIELTDSAGATSAPQFAFIEVLPVNDAPSFAKGPDQTVLEDSAPQTVAGWASGISKGPANESSQTLAFVVTANSNPSLFSSGPAVAANGTLTYTPAPDAAGSATITLVLTDNGGTANGGSSTSAPQSFTITITGVNDAPTFTRGPDQTVAEDSGPRSVPGWAAPFSRGPPDEGGQTLTFDVTATNSALFSAAPAISGTTGTLTFTPAANANGTSSVTVLLRDNGGTANGGADASAPQTFTITITPVDDPPVAVSFARTTGEEQPVAIPLVAIELDGDPVTFSVTAPPSASAGVLSGTPPALVFTPAPYFTGTVLVQYTVSDGISTSPPAVVTITVATAAGRVVALLENPDPDPGDDFGAAAAASGGIFAVGAPGDDPGGVSDAGSVYLFDAASGAPLGAIANPFAAADDRFGEGLAALGPLLVAGAPGADVNGVAGAGLVHVFEAATRVHLFTLLAPTPSAGAAFGSALAADGGRIVVAAPFAPSGGVANAGALFVYNGVNGVFLREIANPNPSGGDMFGAALAGGSVFVGAPGDDLAGPTDSGTVHRFDSSTGALLRTIANPSPASGAGFGAALASTASDLFVGAPGAPSGGVAGAGAVLVLEKSSGALLRTIPNPDPSAGDEFGAALAAAGAAAVVAAPGDDPGGRADAGSIEAFDAASGARTLPSAIAGAAAGDAAGRGLASAPGHLVLSGAPLATSGGVADAGAAVIFEANVRPVAASLSAVALGGSVAIVLSGTDANGDPLTFRLLTAPLSGTLTGAAPNLVYLANPGVVGADGFTYVVHDGRISSRPARVSITISAFGGGGGGGGVIGGTGSGGGGGGGGCAAAASGGAAGPEALLPAALLLLGLLLARRRPARLLRRAGALALGALLAATIPGCFEGGGATTPSSSAARLRRTSSGATPRGRRRRTSTRAT